MNSGGNCRKEAQKTGANLYRRAREFFGESLSSVPFLRLLAFFAAMLAVSDSGRSRFVLQSETHEVDVAAQVVELIGEGRRQFHRVDAELDLLEAGE